MIVFMPYSFHCPQCGFLARKSKPITLLTGFRMSFLGRRNLVAAVHASAHPLPSKFHKKVQEKNETIQNK
jgi:hypothetical protein